MIKGVLGNLGWQLLLPAQGLIDFDLATGLAFEIAGEEDTLSIRKKRKTAKEYFQIVADVVPLISDYMKLGVAEAVNPVCVFDRHEWVVVNLENLKLLLEPLSQTYWERLEAYTRKAYPRGGRTLKKVSAMAITSELGVLLGYFSRRVLAQYDWQFPSPSANRRFLYFVESNIREWEEKLHLEAYPARKWIALHEATHSLQFDINKWLGDYIRSLYGEYLELAGKALQEIEKQLMNERPYPLAWSLFWWKEIIRNNYQNIMGKIQAVMSFLEGYSQHVMIEVGKKHLPYDDYLIAVFRKHLGQSLAGLILERLLGFQHKMKQYELGEAFVSWVAREKGIEFVNRAWNGPELLPSWEEINNPKLWISRVE